MALVAVAQSDPDEFTGVMWDFSFRSTMRNVDHRKAVGFLECRKGLLRLRADDTIE